MFARKFIDQKLRPRAHAHLACLLVAEDDKVESAVKE